MEKAFKYIQTVLLSCVILVAGNGYTINKTECEESRMQEVTIGNPDQCCEDSCCTVHRCCCKITTTRFQAANFHSIKKKPVFSNSTGLLSLTFATNELHYTSYNHSPSTAAFHPPPGLPGKHRLLQYSLLLI